MSAFFDAWIAIGMIAGIYTSLWLAREKVGYRAMLVMMGFFFFIITMIILAPFILGSGGG